jgi:hypothetical protein
LKEMVNRSSELAAILLLRLKVGHQCKCTSEVFCLPLQNLVRWDVELLSDQVSRDEWMRRESPTRRQPLSVEPYRGGSAATASLHFVMASVSASIGASSTSVAGSPSSVRKLCLITSF